ncbi:MAG: aspartate aminotransferase family protein [Bacteroidales bacterium]|nr:aspartate aminotransferase family protein [Bacteroidales bacterium]MDD4167139.1 aspartate aminotransferase family protein [Bacteroidales bacterium]MDD4472693.1 aspartate aminotransferase family protein [Bacteroidales bacterium]MDD5046289.1 aspartate aminotransferase family protein [Bacteroidales bacterium]
MSLYPVYKLWNINAVKATGCVITDDAGIDYLDFYGGHAVISIGHSHPEYVQALSNQLQHIGFYSNAIVNPLQEELAEALARISGYPHHRLFLCNSGAEANENALKLASFQTGRARVLAFRRSFHGRTSGTVALTDDPSIRAPFNAGHLIDFIDLDDFDALHAAFGQHDYAAVIIEGIQGVGGIREASAGFMKALRDHCTRHNTFLILDEIQSGYGRTGTFFAHQSAGIKADIITMAKGMGNGFPVGGLLISPDFTPIAGQLGTTFGGNYLACRAALTVIKVMETENLMNNAREVGSYIIEKLQQIPFGISQVRGRGLMIGIETERDLRKGPSLREDLLWKGHIFTGTSGPYILRLLPPLCITKEQANKLITFLEQWYTSHR